MKQFSLGKNHRLCAKIAVDRLFSNTGGSHTVMAYPLRAVWAENPGREKGESVQFLISIPKKRIRHAVDRVTARRRVREAYRLNRGALIPSEVAVPVDVAFVYISNSLESYSRIEKSVKRILTGIFGGCNKHMDESRS